jgi:NADH:quinone reductase (non-electrogenic)
MATKHRVVVVGGGFGGLPATRLLARSHDVEITLIDRRNLHLFQPLLYQVATGILSPGQLVGQVRELATRSLERDSRSIDPADMRVVLIDGGKEPLR